MWKCGSKGCGRNKNSIGGNCFFKTQNSYCGWVSYHKKSNGKPYSQRMCTQLPSFDQFYKYRIPNPDPQNFQHGWFCLKCGTANKKNNGKCFTTDCDMEEPTEKYGG